MLQRIGLEWWRDARGYRLEKLALNEEAISASPLPIAARVSAQLFLLEMRALDGQSATPSAREPIISLPEGWWVNQPFVKPQRILRAGGSLIPYRPVEMLDQIFNAYINTEPTPEGLLGFINRFGPLTRRGLDENFGEPLDFAINNLKCTVSLIEAFGQTAKADQRRAVTKLLGADGIELYGIKVRVLFDEQTQTLRTEHVARDLTAALWLRVLEVQASDIVMRKCGHCCAWFTAGMGTGRHLNARFCTDEHRITFNSLKRTPKAVAA